MDQKKLNELIQSAKEGDYSKLEELKEIISPEDYEAAVKLFNEYSEKSEAEILKELIRIKNAVPNKDEILEAIRPFLNEEQQKRLNKIIEVLNDNE